MGSGQREVPQCINFARTERNVRPFRFASQVYEQSRDPCFAQSMRAKQGSLLGSKLIPEIMIFHCFSSKFTFFGSGRREGSQCINFARTARNVWVPDNGKSPSALILQELSEMFAHSASRLKYTSKAGIPALLKVCEQSRDPCFDQIESQKS